MKKKSVLVVIVIGCIITHLITIRGICATIVVMFGLLLVVRLKVNP